MRTNWYNVIRHIQSDAGGRLFISSGEVDDCLITISNTPRAPAMWASFRLELELYYVLSIGQNVYGMH